MAGCWAKLVYPPDDHPSSSIERISGSARLLRRAVRATDGAPRPHAASLIGHAASASVRRRSQAAGRRRDTIFMQQGITFEVAGSDGERRDRAWPLDLVPRVLTAAEWTTIKRGLAQRIRALNAFVDDVYHAHEIVRAGIVPWSLIVSRPSFARPVHGVRAPGGVYCHVSGCDLVRGRRRSLAGARGQRPHPVRDLVRAREPRGDDAADARAVRRPPRARRSTTTRRCCSTRCARSPRPPTGRRTSSSGRRAR